MTPRAIGVDGAPGGWVGVTLGSVDSTSPTPHIAFTTDFASIVDATHCNDVIVVDMPIGLSDTGHRPADAAARERLGPRRSTFFPTPLRSMLEFEDWAEANAHSKHVSGKGLSKQAWNLIPKIAEVDSAWTPELGHRLVEGHPETSFAEMAGAPVMSKKLTPEGRAERIELLEAHFGVAMTTAINDSPSKWRTDAIDAAALLWTALRVLDGSATRLGGELDSAGRPMQLSI